MRCWRGRVHVLLCVAVVEGVSMAGVVQNSSASIPKLLRRILARTMSQLEHRHRHRMHDFPSNDSMVREDGVSEMMREHHHPWTEPGASVKSQPCHFPPGFKRYTEGAKKALDLFHANKPISWIHYGDGEWMCACGFGMRMNSDGISLRGTGCKELGQELGRYANYNGKSFFVAHTDNFICKGSGIYSSVESCLKKKDIQNWEGFTDGFYFPLIPECAPPHGGMAETLKGRHVVLVGPEHLQPLWKMLDYKQYISVPGGGGAWGDMDRIQKEIKAASRAHPLKHVTFICAGGPAMKVILYRLFPEIGHKDTMLEVGSSLDGFAGVASRDYNSDTGTYCKQYAGWMPSGVCDGHTKGNCGGMM